MNPLIELSLPEEKAIKRGQWTTSKKTWPQKLCFMAVARLDPINTDVDLCVLQALGGMRTVQTGLSLPRVLALIPLCGHVSACLPRKSSHSLQRSRPSVSSREFENRH